MQLSDDLYIQLDRAPSGAKKSALARRCGWALIVVGAIIQVIRPHDTTYGDGNWRYGALVQLAKHQVPTGKYPILQQVFALPLYFIGQKFGRPVPAVGLFNILVLLGTLTVFGIMYRRSVEERWLRAFLLLVLGGTMFPHHVKVFYGEVFTACAIFLGVAFAARRAPFRSGLAVLLAIVNTPTSALGVVLSAASRGLSKRRVLTNFLPLLLAVCGVLLENWVRRGNPFLTGYETDHGNASSLTYSGRFGFSYPLAFGIVSEVASFGKGILFFAPGLWLTFSRARHAVPGALFQVQRECLLVLAGLVVAYGSWWSWYGGWFWGPRFLLFAAFPASMLLASEIARPRLQKGWLLAILVLVVGSVWVGANGAVLGQTNMEVCTANSYQFEAFCWYVPEFSALVRPFVVAPPHLGLSDILTLCWFAAVAVSLSAPLVMALYSSIRRQYWPSPWPDG